MKIIRILALLPVAGLVAACDAGPDKSVDRGINAHHVSTMVAGIWVSPDGCDFWIIDDGLEGYLTDRLTPDGRPVCSGVAPPTTVVGPFKDGSPIPDPI